MKKYSIYILLNICFIIQLKAQDPVITPRLTIKDSYDNIVVSSQNGFIQQLIGSYHGWDPEAIFIGGYNAQSIYGATATKRIFLGGPYSGTSFLAMDIPSGNLGLNVPNPQSYYHGGNNRVFEIFNPNAEMNSQSHLILSNNSIMSGSSAGSISWIARNAQFNKGMAYIGAQLTEDATNDAKARLVFATAHGLQPLVRMVIDPIGNVGIGTTNPTDLLTVAGKIGAREIKVSTNAGADFVFEPNYKLPDLPELEQFIKTNKHLPEIPTAKQMIDNGINLGELNIKLLQKVEELTLHLIEKDKQINTLINRVDVLENKKKNK
jgi:hypothetical protein